MAIVLIEATDAHFAWMLGGGAPQPGLRLPPGGVDAQSVLERVRRHVAIWLIVADSEVVGLCGYKRAPDKAGVVEIGFGIAPSCRRLGHATQAVGALVEATARSPSIRGLIAETAEGNVASQRVLTRNGFVKTGTRSDPHDGSLILWRRDLP